MRLPRLAVVAALALVACGGGKQKQGPVVAAQGLPPANPVAVQRMVEGATAAKDPRMQTRAIALLREAIAIDPKLWEARFDLGVVLANGGDLSRAETELVAAAKIAPEREEVAVALAEVRRRRGSQKEAASALDAFVKEHPTAIEARTLLVAALRDSGQHDKAIAQARDVLARKPGDATALAELALCHLGKGERDTANLLVRQALDVNARSAPSAERVLAGAPSAERVLAGAPSAERVLAGAPSAERVLAGAVAHRVQGLVALAEGDDASAFKAFSMAAQEDPKDTTSRLNMGAVLLRAGSYAKAADQFKSALAASPDETSAQIGLAAALRGESNGKDQKLLEESRSLLAQVLEREPHNVAALFNMGILLSESMKKQADAKPFFERFLDDAPKDHPARAEAEKQISGAGGSGPPAAAAKPAASPPSTPTPKQGGKK